MQPYDVVEVMKKYFVLLHGMNLQSSSVGRRVAK